MKQRTIRNADDRQRAALDLVAIDRFPFVITVTEGERTRSSGANAHYWAEVDYFLEQLNQTIDLVTEHTGYTQLEVKRLIAAEMEPEYAAILFVRSKEAVHEILKMVCGIPTSTKLGTKAFSKFNDRLSQVMSDVIGQVKAFERKSGAG